MTTVKNTAIRQLGSFIRLVQEGGEQALGSLPLIAVNSSPSGIDFEYVIEIRDDEMMAQIGYGKSRKYGHYLVVKTIFVAWSKQNQAVCKKFIHAAHNMNPWATTVIDCVTSGTLDAALPRWGFEFDGRDSYFKRKAPQVVSPKVMA